MLRFLLLCFWLLLIFVILGIPCLLLCYIVRLFSEPLSSRIMQTYVTLAMNLGTFMAGEKITAIGLENIPKDQPVLYVSNHRSLFDILTIYRFFAGPCGCVSKKEWGKIPVLRGFMVFLHCVFLDRKNLKDGLRAMQQVTAELKGGRSMMICPEGTRNHGDTLLPFHEGSLRPAFQSGVPIVPVTFTHTDDIFENHKPFVRAANVTVCFGAPIPTAGLDRPAQKQLSQQLPQLIQETYEKYV